MQSKAEPTKPSFLKDIINRIDELYECFPLVASQVLTNIRMDVDVMTGFDSPAVRILAKYQVPVLLQSLVSVGAFNEDASRACGYKLAVKLNVSDETVSGPSEAQKYFNDYALLFSERIREGCPYRMLALNVPLNRDILNRLQNAILPVLGEVANLPCANDHLSARFVFGMVSET